MVPGSNKQDIHRLFSSSGNQEPRPIYGIRPSTLLAASVKNIKLQPPHSLPESHNQSITLTRLSLISLSRRMISLKMAQATDKIYRSWPHGPPTYSQANPGQARDITQNSGWNYSLFDCCDPGSLCKADITALS